MLKKILILFLVQLSLISKLSSSENITIKRPGNGINPLEYWSLLGKESKRDFEVDELITK